MTIGATTSQRHYAAGLYYVELCVSCRIEAIEPGRLLGRIWRTLDSDADGTLSWKELSYSGLPLFALERPESTIISLDRSQSID